jgi:ribosomal protein L37E
MIDKSNVTSIGSRKVPMIYTCACGHRAFELSENGLVSCANCGVTADQFMVTLLRPGVAQRVYEFSEWAEKNWE